MLGWIAFVLIAFTVGSAIVGVRSASDASGPGESDRAERILAHAFPDRAHEAVLVASPSAPPATVRRRERRARHAHRSRGDAVLACDPQEAMSTTL